MMNSLTTTTTPILLRVVLFCFFLRHITSQELLADVNEIVHHHHADEGNIVQIHNIGEVSNGVVEVDRREDDENEDSFHVGYRQLGNSWPC